MRDTLRAQPRPLARQGAGGLDASHERLLRVIETAPDKALAARYGVISGNATGHYDEHARMLVAWRARENS